MDKYTKAFLTMIALSVLALPVKAEEKVWYCEMTGLAHTTSEGAETYKPEKFKLKVTPELVLFGKGGITSDLKLPIAWWGTEINWRASGDYDTLMFEDGLLNYATALSNVAVAFSARCDDF